MFFHFTTACAAALGRGRFYAANGEWVFLDLFWPGAPIFNIESSVWQVGRIAEGATAERRTNINFLRVFDLDFPWPLGFSFKPIGCTAPLHSTTPGVSYHGPHHQTGTPIGPSPEGVHQNTGEEPASKKPRQNHTRQGLLLGLTAELQSLYSLWCCSSAIRPA